jgi:nucleoside-diphosphate-sugar epimerase
MTLVTGATGLVGSRLLEELLRRHEPVRALVRDSGRARAFQEQGAEVISGDVRDPATFEGALDDVGVVHHCAAVVGHFTRRQIYDTNYNGVKNLLNACRRRSKAPRVIFVSSVNVLGTRNLDPAMEDLPYRYSGDPAADVKIDAERLVLEYARQGVEATIVRPGFIYGPGDTRNLPAVVAAIAHGKFRFIGSRDNLVPIVHVDDVVQALVLAANTPVASGSIYNITDGSRTSIGALADYLAQQLGCPPPDKVLPYSVPYLICAAFDVLNRIRIWRGPGPVTRAGLRFLGSSRFIDISRARTELGYCPRVNYREGMAASLESIKDRQLEAGHGPGKQGVGVLRSP